MKYEYRICDRCGKTIEPLHGWFMQRNTQSCELSTTTEEPSVYTTRDYVEEFRKEVELVKEEEIRRLKNETMAIVLESYYLKQYKNFELCGDCRKEFEKFMREKQ